MIRQRYDKPRDGVGIRDQCAVIEPIGAYGGPVRGCLARSGGGPAGAAETPRRQLVTWPIDASNEVLVPVPGCRYDSRSSSPRMLGCGILDDGCTGARGGERG